MSKALANLIANRFIARQDVKAIQSASGAYSPIRTPWTRDDLDAHLTGQRTFGHYIISADNHCKLITFDIDLEKTGYLPTARTDDGWCNFTPVEDLRAAWHQRNHFARDYMKMQFRILAHQFARTAQDLLGIETAVAYSGNKGLHVYCFTGLVESSKAREGGEIILDELGFTPVPKTVMFKHPRSVPDPLDDTYLGNLSVEIFPKQASLEGKDLGNLVRLPLGKNQKSPDPTFFVDMTAPLNALVPIDALRALTPGYNMWQTPAEAMA